MADLDRLQGLTPYQAIQALQRLGYAVERVGGGHFVLEHPTRPPLGMPYRTIPTVAPELLLAHLRTAGVTIAEFVAAQEES